jgi:hypothetical protein
MAAACARASGRKSIAEQALLRDADRKKNKRGKNQAGMLARADKELDGKISSPETPRHVLR